MNNKIWKNFILMIRSPYGRAFNIFLISQGLFLIFFFSIQLLTDNNMTFVNIAQSWMGERGMHSVQMAYFLVFVYIFICLNTNVFIKELTNLLINTSPISENKRAEVILLKNKALDWLGNSKYITGGIAVLVPLLFIFFYKDEYWTLMLQVSEVLSIILFSIFVYVDLICLEICDLFLSETNLTSEDKQKYNLFQASIKLYLMASDAPGLFGLFVILVFSYVLHPLLNLLYWQGFIVGAMGLHMAFSQSSLAFLGLIEYKCEQNVCLK